MPDAVQQTTDGGLQGQLAQISMELGRQSTQLAIIGTKLDSVISNSTDHEARIRVLETSKAKIIGAASSVGLLSGGTATLIYWALQRH